MIMSKLKLLMPVTLGETESVITNCITWLGLICCPSRFHVKVIRLDAVDGFQFCVVMLRVRGEFPLFFKYKVKFFEPPGSRSPKLSDDVAFVHGRSQYTPIPTALIVPVPESVF